ncbi:MAG: deoxynucleoside kinase [Patescibacteria group bacterium]
MKEQNEYIAVMGTMGSGKTTAAQLLSKELRFSLIEENVKENAFLPRFYKDMKRWAFHSQVFFLMEKIRQMLETKNMLVKTSVVQDTPITQDVFSYARAQHELGNMDDAEWALYQKIYHEFTPHFPQPDLIVFLDTSIPAIEQRIAARGRGFEQTIPTDYLELLDKLNRRWLEQNTTIPVVRIPTDTLDIARNRDAQEQFVSIVRSALSRKK